MVTTLVKQCCARRTRLAVMCIYADLPTFMCIYADLPTVMCIFAERFLVLLRHDNATTVKYQLSVSGRQSQNLFKSIYSSLHHTNVF